MRKELGKPIKINSAYRTPEHNHKVGGKKNSLHVQAKAADIVVSGMTPKDVHAKILDLIACKKMAEGGLGLYNTFVHYDVRGYKARW
nr:D-Ala-D-Ala carboxypeptidase family metallohydrolase [Agarivorans gilvus]